MAIWIGVATRIIVNVGVLIQRLRLSNLSVRKGLLFRIASANKKFIWSASEFVWTSEPSLSRRVVPRQEVIKPGFIIPFFLGELLPCSVKSSCIWSGIALRCCSPTDTGEEFLTEWQIIMPTHRGERATLIEDHP